MKLDCVGLIVVSAQCRHKKNCVCLPVLSALHGNKNTAPAQYWQHMPEATQQTMK